MNELVSQPISDMCSIDASGIGAGGVWMSKDSSYPPTVWRVEWLVEIGCRVAAISGLTEDYYSRDRQVADAAIKNGRVASTTHDMTSFGEK